MCLFVQAYVCEVGYFMDAPGGPARSPTGATSASFQLPERGEEGEDEEDDLFASSSASGRLHDVFYVLRQMSKVRWFASPVPTVATESRHTHTHSHNHSTHILLLLPPHCAWPRQVKL